MPQYLMRFHSGDLLKLEAENRKNLQAFIDNMMTMEKLTRVQTNLALLRKHQETTLPQGENL